VNNSLKTEHRVENEESDTKQTVALPYSTPMDLWRAFRAGAKFVLRYHGISYDVTRMEPREKVVFVSPPSMSVKVFPNGKGNEGTPHIWLEQRTPIPHDATAQP